MCCRLRSGMGRNMDQIRIKGLQVYAYHGVFTEEKKLGQRFIVDADLYTDTRRAGRSDRLTESTHYGEVCQTIQKALTERSFDLIEAAAERTAQEILLHYPLVRCVELTLHKPQAPISLPFEDVSIRIRRGWHTAYIALGSNMGDRRAYLDGAVQALKGRTDSRVEAVSPLYVTAPYGGVAEGDFLNGVLRLETLLEPEELLDVMQGIEQQAGRERKVHWGSRTLDLDLLFFDDAVIDTERLTVPHPDMENRDFVLEPLARIAPWLRHPVNGLTVRAMLESLPDRGEEGEAAIRILE